MIVQIVASTFRPVMITIESYNELSHIISALELAVDNPESLEQKTIINKLLDMIKSL